MSRRGRPSGGKPPRRLPPRLPTFDPNPSAAFARDMLARARVRGVLIGRLAVWYWVPPSQQEYTKDVDVAVSSSDLPAVAAALADARLATVALPVGGLNASTPTGSINVDFIDRSDPFWGDLNPLIVDSINEAAAAQRHVQAGRGVLLVASAEHTAALKLGAGDPRHEPDVERLIAVPSTNIDRLRDLVRRFVGPAGTGRLEAILRHVGHPAAIRRGPYA